MQLFAAHPLAVVLYSYSADRLILLIELGLDCSEFTVNILAVRSAAHWLALWAAN